ncbi:hypothetical protein ACLB1R_24770 [Escherichia coli]
MVVVVRRKQHQWRCLSPLCGIGEVYFPFVLANPLLVFATMGGLAVCFCSYR